MSNVTMQTVIEEQSQTRKLDLRYVNNNQCKQIQLVIYDNKILNNHYTIGRVSVCCGDAGVP